MTRRFEVSPYARYVLAGLWLTACGASESLHTPPRLPPTQPGVFVRPTPVVETPDADLAPSLSPNAANVVYAANSGGNLDIFLRPVVGGAAERLTSHSTDDTDPAFSHDGKHIAWVSQSDDVKGDIWLMDVKGGNKRRITDRDTSDRAPVFSADDRALYFGALASGAIIEHIDRLELASGLRTTVVAKGWDPAPSPDGKHLFYSAPGSDGRPRLFVMRLVDRRVAALTDGAYSEGFARATRTGSDIEVVFCRFVDDQDNNGVADADDPASLWSVRFDDALFSGASPNPAVPLTSGANGEILPSVAAGWLVFTVGRGLDVDVQSLPLTGTINRETSAETVLLAARAEDDPALRRLGLRYVVATAKDLVASARYELARELAERGKLTDAIDELARVAASDSGDGLAPLARIESERLRVLQRLNGRLLVREAAERSFVEARAKDVEAIYANQQQDARLTARKRTFDSEVSLALGRRNQAVRGFIAVAAEPNVNAEDGARALDRLGELYAEMGEIDALAQTSHDILQRFGDERFYAHRAALRWVDAARHSEGIAPLAALASIVHSQTELPQVASQAEFAMAELQASLGYDTVALDTWRTLVTRYPHERTLLAQALIHLGAAAERKGDAELALTAYERLLSDYSQARDIRAVARRGLVRIAVRKAMSEERAGALTLARDSYLRLLRNDRELVLAHRRYIALSSTLHQLDGVLTHYQQEAQARPRDKIARYGYGYALTYTTPLRQDDAEREIQAALDLDTRFAAAHLALGWLRERRETQRPNRGWLENALASYETAAELVDVQSEPELWAAATLNRGNVLLALGKNDLAFAAYLAREQSGVPHENSLAELLFRESFARTALRQEEYDVAIDMARTADRLSRRLHGQPRQSAIAALLGATYLLTEGYDDALRWYNEATRDCRTRKDWARLVPLLRGKALAEQGLGQFDAALATTNEILVVLAHGDGPPDPPRSWLMTEIPGNPKNVTRAPYGFSPRQEEELARATATRVLRWHGDMSRALAFDRDRLRLLRKAAKDSTIGPRIPLELLHAHNDSALLNMRAGLYQQATERWQEAALIAKQNTWWPELASVTESLSWVWATDPATRTQKSVAAVREAAVAGLDTKSEADAQTRERLARVLSLQHLAEAVSPVPVAKGAAKSALRQLVDALDQHLADQQLAQAYATQANDVALARTLGSPQDAPASTTQDALPSQWRRDVDNALLVNGAARDEAWLRALTTYERDARESLAPERRLLIATATELLCARGETERAWRVLERDRLLQLRPPPTRVTKGDLARDWERIRLLRSTPEHTTQLSKTSTLVQALEGQATTLKQLQTALAGAVFLQVFAPTPDRWHWFVIARDRLQHVVTPPSASDLPASVHALLGAGDTNNGRLFVDVGELIEQPSSTFHSGQRLLSADFEIVDELSATYFVAATEQRNLGRHGTLVIGGGTASKDTVIITAKEATGDTVTRQGSQRNIVMIALPGLLQAAPTMRPGLTQIVFHGDDGTRMDLDTLPAVLTPANLGLATSLDTSRRAARATSQALLLAGIPSVIVGKYTQNTQHLLDQLYPALANEPVAKVFHALLNDDRHARGLHLFGDSGLDTSGRIDLAIKTLGTLAALASKRFAAAQKLPSPAAWQEARLAYTTVLDTIMFLRQPANMQRVLAETPLRERLTLNRAGKKIDPKATLAMLEAGSRTGLAKTHLALGEVTESAHLWEQALLDAQGAGDFAQAARHALALGNTLADGRMGQQAIAALDRCVELSRQAKDRVVEADCLVRRATERRGLLQYREAEQDYLQAAKLYAAVDSPSEVQPRRYLGFLYEKSLNDYDRALEHFQTALRTAERRKLDKQRPSLLLDIARVYRQRGDYERALAQVRQAQGTLSAADTQSRAESMLEAAKIYWYRGDYRQAVERQRQGLELARQSGNAFLEIQAQSLAGLIALNQGELANAERDIGVALDLARLTARRAEEAAQRNNLGIVLREAGRLDEAIASFRSALTIDEELGSIEGRAYDLRNLALALERKGEHDEALRSLQTALELSRKIGDRYNELQCVFAIGEVQETRGRGDAETNYKLAAKLSLESAVPEVEWRALYALGRVAEQRGEITRARQLFEQSLSVAERLGRGRSESYSGRGREHLYDDAIRLAVTANDFDAAYRLIEHARGRALLDVLAGGTLEMLDAGGRALVEAELATRDAVIAAQGAQARGLTSTDEAVTIARGAHVRASTALRDAYPRLWRAFVISPPSLNELRAVLPRDATVVDYFVGPRSTTVLVIRADGTSGQRLTVATDSLEKTTRHLRASLATFASVDDELSTLASTLLSPLSPAVLTATHTLVVLPYGPLYHVPFAALPLGDGVVLDHVALSHAPSGALLFDRLRETKTTTPASAVAFAPASDLPFARLEAFAVAGSRAVVGADASETRWRAERADAVAVAAHAEIDSTFPLSSALLLARDGSNDGRLEVREIFGLTRTPALVTLSACNTATGDMQADGWIGLGYGFATAGTRTILATQARISDLAASLVIKHFYRNLRASSTADALRQASLSVRRAYAHPGHWANFMLIGDFR